MIIDLVKHPVLTSKSIRLIQNRQYTFNVDLKLNKLQIKKLIEQLFKVNVISVNTYCPPRKKKNLATSKGYQSQYKRAIITLKSKNSINLISKKTK